jgi:hypothetical protein
MSLRTEKMMKMSENKSETDRAKIERNWCILPEVELRVRLLAYRGVA